MELEQKVELLIAQIQDITLELQRAHERLDDLELDADMAAEQLNRLNKPPGVYLDLIDQMDEEDRQARENFDPREMYEEIDHVGHTAKPSERERPDSTAVDSLDEESQSGSEDSLV